MTLFSNNHILTFLRFMQEYHGLGQNLLEVWSFKSSSTESKGKWKNRCNPEAPHCQRKHETMDMSCLSCFSSFVSRVALAVLWQPWSPLASSPSGGQFVSCYSALLFVFPYCPSPGLHLQTVITPMKRRENFSFNSLVFSLQFSCLCNFICFYIVILFKFFLLSYLWSLGD